MNDTKVEDLKKSLRHERTFVEAERRNKIIDSIVKKIEYVDVFYIRSGNPANSVKFLDNDVIIVWDENDWDIFARYVKCVENCRLTQENVTQGIIVEMADFLGSKYSFCKEIERFLKQIPEQFSIGAQNKEDNSVIQLYIQIAQLFSLFHELAHIESYKGNNRQILVYREFVLDMFNSLNEEAFTPLGHWGELGRKVAALDCEMSEDILEEVVSDVFAIFQTIDFLNAYYHVNKWKLACYCAIAIDHILTFQNMFNAISSAWDGHFAEIMFRLPARKHEIDTYVNELATARCGLGSLILVIVIYSKQRLSKEQINNLWEYRDIYHVDNTGVIACLADEEFICTAIEEAFS